MIFMDETGSETGMYYLRTRPSSKALQFTVEPEKACRSCGINCNILILYNGKKKEF